MSAQGRKASRSTRRRQNQRRRAAIDQRRDTVRRATRSEDAAPKHTRRNVIAGIVVAVVVAAAIGVYVHSLGGPAPSRNLIAQPTGEPSNTLFDFDPPAAFTATYRLDAYDNGSTTTSTQTYKVLRPYDAQVISTSGTSPDGDEQWSVTTSLGLYEQSTAADGPSTQAAAPATGLGDYRLDASIDDLVDDGTYVVLDRRSLLGRDCQVYRTGSPVESYTETKPTDTDHVDLCVDHDGIVLEQLTVKSGEVTEHLVATDVDDDPTLTDADFAMSTPPVALSDGGSELDEIATDTAPTSGYWSFSAAPDGYDLQHRYVLHQTIADPDSETASTDAPKVVVDSYVDVYVDGAKTIIVHQGPTTVEPSPDTAGVDVNVTGLGSVHVASGVRGTTATAHPSSPAGWFVDVTGTVPRADLRADIATLVSSSVTPG
ncbi:MAG: hypothetical protein JWM34_198 [Ilumatobacteraceae bacterium]|nr:hypothetical protein [Ilumatobacteraceae bacterium]